MGELWLFFFTFQDLVRYPPGREGVFAPGGWVCLIYSAMGIVGRPGNSSGAYLHPDSLPQKFLRICVIFGNFQIVLKCYDFKEMLICCKDHIIHSPNTLKRSMLSI